MGKLIIGLVLGVLASSLIFLLLVIPQTRESYRNVGINDGRIAAKYEISQRIEKELGKTDQLYKDEAELFSVKTTLVVVKEVNGVKTLRVYE